MKNLRQRLCEERIIRLAAEWDSTERWSDGHQSGLCRTARGLASPCTQSKLEMRESAGCCSSENSCSHHYAGALRFINKKISVHLCHGPYLSVVLISLVIFIDAGNIEKEVHEKCRSSKSAANMKAAHAAASRAYRARKKNSGWQGRIKVSR